MKALRKLSEIGGAALCAGSPNRALLLEKFGSVTGDALGSLLALKNGFYAFEGALHVLGEPGGPAGRGLVEWNSQRLWRGAYEGMADGAVFFAEDVFGVQFALRDEAVQTFDPETGATDRAGSVS
jgi:hypothetical protein